MSRPMGILIIEPSPLTGNVFRMLCQKWPQKRSYVSGDFEDIDTEWLEKQDKLSCVVGGGALRGEGKRFLALLSDVQPWQKLPKLIVVPHDVTAEELSTWQRLPNCKLLSRPFAPDDFYSLLSPMVK